MFFFCIKSLYIFLWNLEYNYGFLESGPKNRQTIPFIFSKNGGLFRFWFVDVVCKYPKFWRKMFWTHLVFGFSKKPIRDSNSWTKLLVMSFLVVFLLTYLFFLSLVFAYIEGMRDIFWKSKSTYQFCTRLTQLWKVAVIILMQTFKHTKIP